MKKYEEMKAKKAAEAAGKKDGEGKMEYIG